MTVIRLSPSGPPIQNDEGGPANPVGPGFPVRLAEVTSSLDVAGLPTGTFNPIQNTTPATIVAALSKPAPNKRYKVNCSFELSNNSDGDSIATIRVEASYDEQANWNVLSSHSHTIRGFAGPPVSNQTRLVTANVPMTLGSLLDTPIPANAPEIAVRITAGVDGGVVATTTGGTNGTFWLSLAELL